jgi:hypothetical protein
VGVGQLGSLALSLERLFDSLDAGLVLVCLQLLDQLLVGSYDALFDHDGEEGTELLELAADTDHLPQELLVALDVDLVLSDEALVAHHLQEDAERLHLTRVLQSHIEDLLDVVLLYQTPEDLSAVHVEQSHEGLLVLSRQILLGEVVYCFE